MLDRSLGGNIHIEMNFGADLWPVEIDVGEFELAMLNLCANARDAMAGGGTITITAENLQEAAEDGLLTDFVKLSIADTGSGMPPEVLARVFEPFFTTKDIGKGSGLGLPQVYGFAQQSGGRLTIDSEVGNGHHRDPAAAALIAAASCAQGRRRIKRVRRSRRQRAPSSGAACRRRQ